MDPSSLPLPPSIAGHEMPANLEDFPSQIVPENAFFDLSNLDLLRRHEILDMYPDILSMDKGQELDLVLEDSSYLWDTTSSTPMALDSSFDTRPNIRNIDSPTETSSGNVRKRKATTLRAEDWEPYRNRIVELYKEERRTLSDVRKVIREEFGFDAEIRQYQSQIKFWKLDKNTKLREMKAIVRKLQERRILEPEKRDFAFSLRGQPVPQGKINRWMRDKKVSQDALFCSRSSASTTSDLTYHTVSDVASRRYRPSKLIVSQRNRVNAPEEATISVFQAPCSSATVPPVPPAVPYDIDPPSSYEPTCLPSMPHPFILPSKSGFTMDLTTALSDFRKALDSYASLPRQSPTLEALVLWTEKSHAISSQQYILDTLTAMRLEIQDLFGPSKPHHLTAQSLDRHLTTMRARRILHLELNNDSLYPAVGLYQEISELTSNFKFDLKEGLKAFSGEWNRNTYLREVQELLYGAQVWLSGALEEATRLAETAPTFLITHRCEIAVAFLIEELLQDCELDNRQLRKNCTEKDPELLDRLALDRYLAYILHLQGRRSEATDLLLEAIANRQADQFWSCFYETDLLFDILVARVNTGEGLNAFLDAVGSSKLVKAQRGSLIRLLGACLTEWQWENTQLWVVMRSLVSIDSAGSWSQHGQSEWQEMVDLVVYEYVFGRFLQGDSRSALHECHEMIHALSATFNSGNLKHEEAHILLPAIHRAFTKIAEHDMCESFDILHMLESGCEHFNMPRLAMQEKQELCRASSSPVGTFASVEAMVAESDTEMPLFCPEQPLFCG